MEVIANSPGFDGLKVREAGEQFTMPDGAAASWFDPVDGPRRGKKGARIVAAVAPPAPPPEPEHVIPPDPPEGTAGA